MAWDVRMGVAWNVRVGVGGPVCVAEGEGAGVPRVCVAICERVVGRLVEEKQSAHTPKHSLSRTHTHTHERERERENLAYAYSCREFG